MNFAVILLCTITVQVVLSLPATHTREPKRTDFETKDESFERHGGRRDGEPDDDEARNGSDAHRDHEGFEQQRDGFGHHHKEHKKFDRHDGGRENFEREKAFFHSTPAKSGADDAVITVTYVGYNTTSAATEEPSTETTEETTSETTEESSGTLSPEKSESQGENAETEDTTDENSLVDLDLALLKNQQIVKIAKNTLSQAAKQSGVLGALETAPGIEGTGGLTGGLGGLTGGLSGLTGGLSGLTGTLGGLTGGLGLPSVPGVGGVGDLTNKATNVNENTSSQVKKLLEIDMNGKSLLGL